MDLGLEVQDPILFLLPKECFSIRGSLQITAFWNLLPTLPVSCCGCWITAVVPTSAHSILMRLPSLQNISFSTLQRYFHAVQSYWSTAYTLSYDSPISQRYISYSRIWKSTVNTLVNTAKSDVSQEPDQVWMWLPWLANTRRQTFNSITVFMLSATECSAEKFHP